MGCSTDWSGESGVIHGKGVPSDAPPRNNIELWRTFSLHGLCMCVNENCVRDVANLGYEGGTVTTIAELAETTLGRAERFSVKKELAKADTTLLPDETVHLIAVGSYRGAGNSLILVTDTRIVALNEVGSFSKRLQVHDVRYDRVSSVQSEAGRISGSVKLNTSGGDIEIDKILPTGRADEVAAFIRSRM